jgi:hypothetical protein
MTAGPVIPSIADGDALLGSVIRTALKNLQDFVSAIPVDNLERYKCRTEVAFSLGTDFLAGGGSARTRHYGYQKVQVGADSNSASAVYSMNIFIRLAGAIAGTDSFVFTIEESSSVDGTYTTVSGCTHTITATGSTHTDVPGDDATAYGYYVQLAPSTTIAAGKFIRLKVNSSATSQAIPDMNVTLGLETQLQ